eukprot:92480_1
MAKTYDSVEENVSSAIIFARLQLSSRLDCAPSFMPPPLSVLSMVLMVIIYIIGWIINSVRWVLKKRSYNVSVVFMPTFMKQKQLQLDEQILYDNCHKNWEIITNKGPTRCQIVKYQQHIRTHYVKFYTHDMTEIRVSIDNNIDKKHEWSLDLMHLYKSRLIDLEQFSKVEVNRDWMD